jgi:hypothetical protein
MRAVAVGIVAIIVMMGMIMMNMVTFAMIWPTLELWTPVA